MKLQNVESIVEKHRSDQGALIAILSDIQALYGYLPQETLKAVAELTGASLIDIYGVATFYKYFSLKPRGKHLCSVCVGTACHVRGSEVIAKEFENKLEIEAGETTTDREFTLERVACLGACALGPIVVTDGHYFSKVGVSKVGKILEQTRHGLDKVEVQTDARVFPIDVSCPRCNHSMMDAKHMIDGYPSIRVTTSFGRKHGWVRLSSLYGSYSVEMEPEIPLDTVADFFCPHCHGELIGGVACVECSAPTVSLIVRQGGIAQVCARRGCHGHMLDLDGSNA